MKITNTYFLSKQFKNFYRYPNHTFIFYDKLHELLKIGFLAFLPYSGQPVRSGTIVIGLLPFTSSIDSKDYITHLSNLCRHFLE